MIASRGGLVWVGGGGGADLLEGVHHLHPFSPSCSPGPLHPAAELLQSGGRLPHPTTTTPGRERARARGGQGAETDTPARGHRSAQGDRQAPIATGHRERHNVGAGNHPRARKGREQGPGRRERGHHGGHQDPHARRAYHEGGTGAPPPPTDAARPPGAHAPNTHRPSTNQKPYRSHRHTPTSHREPHRGWRAYLHKKNGLHPQRKPLGTPPRSPPPRPHRQATILATTRATSQTPEEDEGTATAPRVRDRDPQRTRDHGTGPHGGQCYGFEQQQRGSAQVASRSRNRTAVCE